MRKIRKGKCEEGEEKPGGSIGSNHLFTFFFSLFFANIFFFFSFKTETLHFKNNNDARLVMNEYFLTMKKVFLEGNEGGRT